MLTVAVTSAVFDQTCVPLIVGFGACLHSIQQRLWLYPCLTSALLQANTAVWGLAVRQ